jgi:hypothetical protein
VGPADAGLDPVDLAADGAGKAPALCCPLCEGVLREGFLAPRNLGLFLNGMPVEWQSGASRGSSRWGYSPGDEILPVRAARCERCGRLELYAVG